MADIGTLNPEQMLQQQQILRQQKMAEMLMQQGMQQPQGQMISGHYVAPSIFQNLAGLANTFVGQRGIEKSDQAQLDLAKAIRAQNTDELNQFNQLLPKNPMEAYSFAAQANNPKLQDIGFKKMLPQEFDLSEGQKRYMTMPDGTVKEVASGGQKFRAPLQIDTGTAIELRDPNNPTLVLQRIPKSMSPADAARLADEGIIVGGGGGQPMVRTGAPVGQPQGVPQGVPQSQSQGQPAVMPPLNVAGLSPKAAREAQAEQAKTYQENVKNAYEVAKIFPAIEKALPNAHGSGIGNIMGGVANFVGYESSRNAADAELKVMSDKLLKAVPRFSGPQSDKDVASYKEAAGSIGDASLPMNVRMAALNTIKELNKPYAPNLNWDSPTLVAEPNKNKPNAPQQTSKAPVGVDPAVWAVMTPAEKSLWK